MKKVLIIVSVVVIALAGIGVGAYFLTREKSPEQQVVGTWYDGENDVTIELKSNKSLKITKESGESRTGTWRIAGDKIKFTATSGPKAEGELSQALGRLFAVAENYPELKANEGFIRFQQQQQEIEDKIQGARRFYNGGVRDLNIKIKVFPTNIFAKKLGFEKREFFEVEDRKVVESAPQVKF